MDIEVESSKRKMNAVPSPAPGSAIHNSKAWERKR
jgi:hypothetical protein